MIGMLARAAVLVLVGALAGAAFNGLSHDGLRIGAFAAPAMCDAEAGAPVEIAPGEAAHLCGRDDVVIADARAASRFAEGHVAGAIHLPCDAAGSVAADALSRLERARTIVVYGQTTDEALPVAASLRRRFHAPERRVLVLTGGFNSWDKAGLACASGPCDDCKAHEASRP
jgi:rhodanese-related sulfurtransferase